MLPISIILLLSLIQISKTSLKSYKNIRNLLAYEYSPTGVNSYLNDFFSFRWIYVPIPILLLIRWWRCMPLIVFAGLTVLAKFKRKSKNLRSKKVFLFICFFRRNLWSNSKISYFNQNSYEFLFSILFFFLIFLGTYN